MRLGREGGKEGSREARREGGRQEILIFLWCMI